MGFYPVCPGQTDYVLGSPIFDKIKLNLDNGKSFTITCENNSKLNKYVQSCLLNGEDYTKSFLNHTMITDGGEFKFIMSNKPNLDFGKDLSSQPISNVPRVAGIPYLCSGNLLFFKNTTVSLCCDTENAVVRYTLDGTEPTETSNKYELPFVIDKSVTLKIRSFATNSLPGSIVSIDFMKAVKPIDPEKLKNGIHYQYYEGIYRSVYDWLNDAPVSAGICNKIDFSMIKRPDWWGISYSAYLFVPENGKYEFHSLANDGCQLKIDGQELFESDGRKSESLSQHAEIVLTRGYHKFELNYFQCSDLKKLSLVWQGPTFKRTALDKNLFITF